MGKPRAAWQLALATAEVAEQFAIAWLPETLWAPATRVRVTATDRLLRRHPEASPTPRAIDSWPGLANGRRRWADRRLEVLPSLRSYRPGGWRPDVELRGAERITEALAAGKGAVLWVPRFQFSTWVVKVALHREGFDASHLSHRNHGLGQTWPYKRWFNRLRQRPEEAMLRERLVFGSSPVTAVRAAHRRLAENGIVSVTLREEATSVSLHPFFDRTFAVPDGPIRMAKRAGAPLLPVISVRDRAGRFIVTVAPDLLATPDGKARSPKEAASALVSLLQDYCTRYPGQLNGMFDPEALSPTKGHP